MGAMAARLGLDPVLLVAQALDLAGEETPRVRWACSMASGGLAAPGGARAPRAAPTGVGDGGRARGSRALLEARSWVDVHRTGGMSGILTRVTASVGGDHRGSCGAPGGSACGGGATGRGGRPLRGRPSLNLHPAIWPQGRLALARAAAWALVLEGIEAFPTDPRPVAVAGAVALADPRQLPAWAREALAASGDWRDRYNLALVLKERGEAAACGEQAAVALNGEGLSPAERQRLSLLAHGCAVDSGDVARADALGHGVRRRARLRSTTTRFCT